MAALVTPLAVVFALAALLAFEPILRELAGALLHDSGIALAAGLLLIGSLACERFPDERYIHGWMIVAAAVALLEVLAATILIDDSWLPEVGRLELVCAMCSAPFLIAAVRALRSSPSLRRARTVVACALAIAAIGAAAGAQAFLGRGHGLFTPPLDGMIGSLPDPLRARACAEVVAGTILFAGARQMGRSSIALAACGLACMAAAGRDAITCAAAQSMNASVRAETAFDVAWLETLAIVGTAWDIAAGVGVGVACAAALIACLGARAARSRASLRAVAYAIPVGVWILGAIGDPFWPRSWETVEPPWRGTGIEPIELRWGGRWEYDDRSTLVLDREGASVRGWPNDGLHLPHHWIVPDARVRLRDLVDRIGPTGDARVELVGGSARSRRLENAERARARFAIVELGSRLTQSIPIEVVDRTELASRSRSHGRAACTFRWREPRPQRRCLAVLVLDDFPADARLSDALAMYPSRIVATTSGFPRTQPLVGRPVHSVPEAESWLGCSILSAFTLTLLIALVLARAHWTRRSSSHGHVRPGWIAPSACDTMIGDQTPQGYRISLVMRARTASRFPAALARTIVHALRDVHPWWAIAVALSLWLLRFI